MNSSIASAIGPERRTGMGMAMEAAWNASTLRATIPAEAFVKGNTGLAPPAGRL